MWYVAYTHIYICTDAFWYDIRIFLFPNSLFAFKIGLGISCNTFPSAEDILILVREGSYTSNYNLTAQIVNIGRKSMK